MGRGLDHKLATEVARQLMVQDALGAHARDDIGITDALAARPLQAALTSAFSFALGGVVPLLAGVLAPAGTTAFVIAPVSLIFLAALGALAAYAGGATLLRGAIRVLIWASLAMGVTFAVGTLFGAPPS